MNKRRLNYTLSLVAVFSLLLVLGLSGCTTPTSGEKDVSGFKGNDSTPQICGAPEPFTLWAGQTIDVGTVRVSNDETNLYVTYNTTGDWYLKEAKLYVGLGDAPTERLTPGHAPYKSEDISGDISYTRSYTFTIPLAGFGVTCDVTELWLQAHADVVKLDNNGQIVQSETAYGGDITKPKKGSWYGNISYTVQCCEEEEPCYKWENETAWAAGTRYVEKGNWATYTTYEADSTVILYAGQKMNAGTVDFSSPDENGYITITITLTGDWKFAPVGDNVKIQDYDSTPPADNPDPGHFAWKGTVDPSESSFSITVPENKFYGVHVDVGYWVEVTCK